MTVRAKFQCTAIESYSWSAGRKFVFTPQYDPTIEEDKRFAKATPSGRFEIQIDNPAAAEQFELGKSYYFDVSPVPEPAK